MLHETELSSERRSFLARLKFGAAALAAATLGAAAKAQVKTAPARWEPARHDKDDWLDQLPGSHRLVFDTYDPDGVGLALRFGGNFIRVNRSDYGLQNNDSAVVIVVRHRSVGFGYNDAMWAKYGEAIAKHCEYEDPKTKSVPKVNVYNASGYGNLLTSAGTTLESLAKLGVQFAVCSSATRAVAREAAGAAGPETDKIYNELTANLVGNSRMVPAGIVAVSRAQERGYTLATV